MVKLDDDLIMSNVKDQISQTTEQCLQLIDWQKNLLVADLCFRSFLQFLTLCIVGKLFTNARL